MSAGTSNAPKTPNASSAKDKGSDMLKEFRQGKHQEESSYIDLNTSTLDHAFGTIGVDESRFGPSTFNNPAAIAGSKLISKYSETKRRNIDGSKSSSLKPSQQAEFDALNSIQYVVAKLKQLNTGDSQSVSSIVSSLKPIEEYIKLQQARSTRTNEFTSKIFTPKSSKLVYGDDDSHASSEISAFYSPVNASHLLDKSKQHQRSVLKVYMENQLDLNEAEMDYYENVVNDLVEKLERMKIENDDLQEKVLSHEEHIRNINEYQLRNDEAKNLVLQFDLERAEFTNKVVTLEQKLYKLNNSHAQELEANEKLRNEVKILKLKITDDEKKHLLAIDDVQKRSHSSNQDRELLRRNEELTNKIEELESEVSNTQGEMDKLYEVIEDLRSKLHTSDNRTNNMKKQLTLEITSLTEQFEEASRQLSYKDIVIQSLQVDKERLNGELDVVKKDKPSGGSNSSTKQFNTSIAPSNVFDPNVSNIPRFSGGKNDLMNKLLFTPGNNMNDSVSGIRQTSQSKQSRLKVYMDNQFDNQLDLNEAEMDYYENIVNDLAEKLDAANKEKEKLENDLEEATLNIDAKEKELERCNELFMRFKSSIDEKDVTIQKLSDQLHSLQSQSRSYSKTIKSIAAAHSASSDSYHSDFEATGLDALHTVGSGEDMDDSGELFSRPIGFLNANSNQTSSSPKPTTVEGLRLLLQEKENQIKTRDSQIQSLQDLLSEQKTAYSNVKQQRNKLKKLLEEANTNSSAEQLAEADSIIVDLRDQLQEAEEKNQQLADSLSSMQTKLLEQQLQLEIRDEEKDQLQSSRSMGYASPSSRSSRHGNNERSASKSQAKIDELITQLAELNKNHEELSFEYEKLLIRFQSKTKQTEDLYKDNQFLREELENKLQDVDRLKFSEMKYDALSKLKQIDNENEIEVLRERLNTYEGRINDLELVLTDEREQNDSLKLFLNKLGEKDETTESLLESTTNELNAIKKLYLAKVEECTTFQLQIEKYHSLVEEKEKENRQTSMALLHAQQIPTPTKSITPSCNIQSHADLKSNVDELKSKLTFLQSQYDSVFSEKIEAENIYRITKEQLQMCENILLNKTEEFLQLQTPLSKLKVNISSFAQKSSFAENAFFNKISSYMNNYEVRIQYMGNLVHTLSATFNNLKNHSNIVEANFKDSQITLKKLTARYESQTGELNDRVAEIARLNNAIMELKYSFEEKQQQTKNLENSMEQSIMIQPEEYDHLIQRLNDAEKRAIIMSTEGAKSFARSTRTIAFLEGECTRLKTLIDHFRIINMKLTNDLKISNNNSMKCAAYEHRIKFVLEDNSSLKEQITSFESLLAKKESELLVLLSQQRDHEGINIDRYEIELQKINDKLKISQDTLITTKRESKSIQDAQEHTNSLLKSELNNLSEKSKLLEKDLQYKTDLLSTVESEFYALKGLYNDKENLYVSSVNKVLLLESELNSNKDQNSYKIIELTSENQEKTNRIKVLESNVFALKSKVSELENSFIQRDEELAVKLLKRASVEDENRSLRSQVDDLHSQLSSIRLKYEDALDKWNNLTLEYDSIKNQYNTLNNETLRSTIQKLRDTEDTLSQTSEELLALRIEVKSTRDQLAITRDALMKAESTIATTQAENISLHSSEQIVKTENETLINENEFLTKQVEELLAKIAAFSKEIPSLRGQISSQTDTIEDLSSQIKEITSKFNINASKIAVIDAIESDIVHEVNSYIDVVNAVLTGAASSPALLNGGINSVVQVNKSQIGENEDLSDVSQNISMISTASFGLGKSVHHSNNEMLQPIKHSVITWRNKSDQLIGYFKYLSDAYDNQLKEKDEMHRINNKLNDKIKLITSDRDLQSLKNEKLEEELHLLRNRSSLVEEKDEMLHKTIHAIYANMHVMIREIDGRIMDSLTKTNDLVAGVVPINVNVIADLTVSQSIILSEENVQNRLANKDSLDYGNILSVLSNLSGEVDKSNGYHLSVIGTLLDEIQRCKQIIDKNDLLVASKETNWENERHVLQQRIVTLEGDYDQELLRAQQVYSETEALKDELDKHRQLLHNITNNYNDLEVEYRAVSESNNDLKNTNDNLENITQDLKNKLRVSSNDLDKKQFEASQLMEQLEQTQKRAIEDELSIEKSNALLGRIKAEKDALENIRRSLESELDRSRLELISLRDVKKNFDDENRSSFEIEKLLAALGTTLDQVQPVMMTLTAASDGITAISHNTTPTRDVALYHSSIHSSKHGPTSPLSSNSGGGSLTVTSRVDDAVSRLSNFRSWVRDESKARHILESQNESLANDILSNQQTIDEQAQQIKQIHATLIERDAEISERNNTIIELQYELNKLKDDLQRLKRDLHTNNDYYDEEKRNKTKLLHDLSHKESDMTKLQHEIDTRNNTILKLQETIYTLQESCDDLKAELESKSEALKHAKLNSEKIIVSIEQYENGIENDRKERQLLEKKLFEAENGNNTTILRLKSRIHELENINSEVSNNLKQMQDSSNLVSDQQMRLLKDSEQLKKKNLLLENQLENILKEKNSFVDEITETRRKIAAAKEQAELERQQRLRTEATVETYRKLDEDKRLYLSYSNNSLKAVEDHTAELLQLQAEEEKKSLRIKISELKLSCEEKEAMRIAEENDRKKLEKHIKDLKNTLAKKNQELTTSANYSSMLRTEGRVARKQIMDVISTLREIINVIRIDAQELGITISTPEIKSTSTGDSSGKSGDGDDNHIGLVEALGINELTDQMEGFKEMMSWVKTTSKSRFELESLINKLKDENKELHKELKHMEAKKNELMLSYKEELQTVQTQFNDLRKIDNKNPHMMQQLSIVENSLKIEREKQQKLVTENENLRLKLDHLNQDILLSHQSRSSQGNLQSELDLIRSELEKVKFDYNSMQQEVKAVNHHRNVLRDTIDDLEKHLKSKVDIISDLYAQLDSFSAATGAGGSTNGLRMRNPQTMNQPMNSTSNGIGTSNDDEDSLKRQIIRFKTRANAMDELCSIYRTSILALYADGASYGAAQYGWQHNNEQQEYHAKMNHIIGVGWIEREISIVKHSYEDEIRLLDTEVSELRSKLKQSNSYIVELRKRFEDNMKSIY
eukprot:gene8401-11359_t